jgi:hypothetical protein
MMVLPDEWGHFGSAWAFDEPAMRKLASRGVTNDLEEFRSQFATLSASSTCVVVVQAIRR